MHCECRKGYTCHDCWIEQERNWDEYMMDIFIEGATKEGLADQIKEGA